MNELGFNPDAFTNGILGLTHDKVTGEQNRITRYAGKIITGFGPGEKGDDGKTMNYPRSCGYFRMMKEVDANIKEGGKTVKGKKWVLDKDAQDLLEKVNGGNKKPRIIKVVSLFRSPSDMFDSFLAKYGNGGLLCKGNGAGTRAVCLTYEGENRVRKDRVHDDGTVGCAHENCVDWINGDCKPTGILKCYPDIKFTPPNPYRLDTKSKNSIIRMSSNILEIWEMLQAAHKIKESQTGKELEFNGFFGIELYLIHKQMKSGGHDIFVTEIHPTKSLRDLINKPLSAGISMFQGDGALSLNNAGKSLLESRPSNVKTIDVSDIPDTAEGEDFMSTQFDVTEDATPVDGDVAADVTKTMLDE